MELWIHVDCKYLPPTVESLEKDIGDWARDGATGIVFEWENMFPYPGLDAALRQDAYSCEAIGKILDRCRQFGLKAIPLVQTLGHLEWLLSHDAYRQLREFDHYPPQIRACHSESIALLKSKISALIEAHYDSPYIHLGADEARMLEQIDRPDCSSPKEGACTVFLRHLKPLIEQVVKAGKRPIIWADMPLHHPENLREFPESVIFCDWLYSQTSEYANQVFDWKQSAPVAAANLEQVSTERRRLFEPYWSLGTRDYPNQLYQFPYTPFLRDLGYDVVVGPATLYAANALAATHLPKARANQRGWLLAARRARAMGALNTCWSIRGALRETSKAGHRAFLQQGRQLAALPGDREIATENWRPLVGEAAAMVAEQIDQLNPPTDQLACTKPLFFDPEMRTHRPLAFDQRRQSIQSAIAQSEADSNREDEYLAAVERGETAAAKLGSINSQNEEIEAWRLSAMEVSLRARIRLTVEARLRARPAPFNHDRLIADIELQSTRIQDFMQNRYQPADIHRVKLDHYQGLARLLSQS